MRRQTSTSELPSRATDECAADPLTTLPPQSGWIDTSCGVAAAGRAFFTCTAPIAKQMTVACFMAVTALSQSSLSAHAADAADTNWPCVQKKVDTLTSTQLWDGPVITGEEKWWKDEEVRKLASFATSRRSPITEAEDRVIAMAEATPEAERDARLTLLFAGILDETNKIRRRIIRGIERFQARQRARADALEKKGVELSALQSRANSGERISTQLDAAQVAYNWDARIFKERQDNIPIACQIPIEIEQRAFSLARTIRFQMSG